MAVGMNAEPWPGIQALLCCTACKGLVRLSCWIPTVVIYCAWKLECSPASKSNPGFLTRFQIRELFINLCIMYAIDNRYMIHRIAIDQLQF